ncbi:MAG TPA: MIP/aquaporin family protein [Fimbriimonadaceae bacterium]|nr:MIP/aquaporin family protein [Fimbriimonadaceae bacterium]
MRKRYAAEFLGTFVIVLAPVALAAAGKVSGNDAGLVAAALASGLPVLAMVYAFGPISAAHFNPAVTLGFAVARRFPWRYVPAYWASQLAGAAAAGATAWGIFGVGAGAHVPAHPAAVVQNLALEAVLAFFLMLTIIAVATDRRVSGTAPPLAIGLTVVFCVLIGGPVTGGSMNPARSFGPALFVPGALPYMWLYVLGPMLGAVAAALAYEAVRLEGEHAKGAPNELLAALEEIRGEGSAV